MPPRKRAKTATCNKPDPDTQTLVLARKKAQSLGKIPVSHTVAAMNALERTASKEKSHHGKDTIQYICDFGHCKKLQHANELFMGKNFLNGSEVNKLKNRHLVTKKNPWTWTISRSHNRSS